MMKIFLCVMLLVLVTVIEAGWFKGRRNVVKHTSSSSSSRKPQHQQCLGLCLTKHRDHLIEKICPDPCEGINCNGRGVCSNGRCTCQDGFSGCDCQDMIDPCITVVCNNGGSCDSSNGECTCAMGFEGEFCDDMIDPCITVVCNNGGSCDSSNGECTCAMGFEGEFCDDMIDPCITVVCNNGGSCDSSNGECTCAMGFEGEFCDVFIDPCAQMECFNGGTCNNGSCECTSRFRGDTCDTAVCTRQVNMGANPVLIQSLDVDVSRRNNDTNIDTCETSCADAANCRSYAFVTDVNGAQVCLFYTTDVTLADGILSPVFGLVSFNATTVGICVSNLNCTRRENVITYSVPVDPVEGIFTDDIDACESRCIDDTTCGGYEFESEFNTCALYGNDAPLMLASDATVGSCPLVCTRNANMATTSEDGIRAIFNNIDGCQDACNVVIPGCRGYQFLTGSNECFIYTDDISSSLTSNSNATTAICI